ncbi:MAG: carbohydrate kinase family protein [Candidatus Hermodarchaeota archaeon]
MTEKLDVICIGAALVDMVAQVERHPLDDDEVFVSELKLMSGGAAANTAYACAKIGLKTAFIGKLGTNDTFGAKILNDFKEVNMSLSLIKYSKTQGTGSAYVALNKKGDRRIYAHSGAANYLSKQDIKEEEIISAKVIYLSSLKNLDPFIEAAKIGKNNKVPVILNPGMLIIDQGLKNIEQLLQNLDILILSKREFKTLLNITEVRLNEEILREKAQILLNLGIKIIIVTLGEEGALLIADNNSELIHSSKISQVLDTTGAGDAFSAGFIYGFIQDLSFKFDLLKKNVKIGNYIAGKCIQQLGARNGIPNPEELKQIL